MTYAGLLAGLRVAARLPQCASRRLMRRPVDALTVVTSAMLIVAGVGAVPAKVPYKAPPEKPAWFEAKSVCLFRLGAERMPETAEELSDALQLGWGQSITFPDPAGVVSMERVAFPSIGALRIDLSDGQIKTEPGKKDRIKINNRVERALQVGTLDVRGEPLLVKKSRLNMSLHADGARLVLERDKGGQPVMMLEDATSGKLNFEVSVADAEAIMLFNAREAASHYGVTVERMKLKVVPETPRSLQASLHISTLIGFVPAGMMFKAHVTVDDGMNAKLTGLTCDGDEALGPLIVGLLRPALAKHNNETRPLVSFPAGKLQLRDVGVRVDDSLHLTAAFGR